MTTASYTGPTLHDGDASFRAWGLAFSNALGTLTELVQTADTGQINWATVTRPAVSTMAGYEIYYLNDSMHATSPIYLKIQYGTGSVAGGPHIKIIVGSSTDGAGTLSGTLSALSFACNMGAAGVVTTYSHYFCATEGAFWFEFAGGSASQGTFMVLRTCDTTGAADGYGTAVFSYGNNNGAASSATRYSFAYHRNTGTPGVANSSIAGDNIQIVNRPTGLVVAESVMPNGDYPAYLAWGQYPDVRPFQNACGVFPTHAPAGGTTFSATLIGSTAHTYIVTEQWLTFCEGTLSLARIWE